MVSENHKSNAVLLIVHTIKSDKDLKYKRRNVCTFTFSFEQNIL